MCLTVPHKIKKVSGHKAELDDGRMVDISLLLMDKAGLPAEARSSASLGRAKAGDWVLFTNSYAVKKITNNEALDILKLLETIPEINLDSLSPRFKDIIEAAGKRVLTSPEIEYLLGLNDPRHLQALYAEADTIRRAYAKDHVCVHGIIEFSNYCGHDCLYCGLRKSNENVLRYRLREEEIVETAVEAINNTGYKMIVLQSGDDYWYTEDKLIRIISEIKKQARAFIYLSIGDRLISTYKKLKQAGANGVLYRFETSNPKLFASLHPNGTLKERLANLSALKKLGYIISTGPLIGLPGQNVRDLAEDVLLLNKFKVFMPSMGPFIAAANTPLGEMRDGSFAMSLKMIAVTRLIMKTAQIPITTAMETIGPKNARELAFKAGANSLMFTLTPEEHRQDYSIYRDKFFDREKKLADLALFKGEASYEMMERELRIKI